MYCTSLTPVHDTTEENTSIGRARFLGGGECKACITGQNRYRHMPSGYSVSLLGQSLAGLGKQHSEYLGEACRWGKMGVRGQG